MSSQVVNGAGAGIWGRVRVLGEAVPGTQLLEVINK